MAAVVVDRAAHRLVVGLPLFFFDRTCDEQNWHDAMDALLLLFGRQLLASDDVEKSLDNAMRMLKFMLARSKGS
jgi:hypothetical protein